MEELQQEDNIIDADVEALPDNPSEEQAEEVLAQQDIDDPAPEDVAALEFQTWLPLFKKAIGSLKSRKAVSRICKALVEFPMQEERIRFMSKREEEVFKIGLKLMDAKYTMLTKLENMTEEERAELREEREEEIEEALSEDSSEE